jgi:hypothetical protein
LAGTSELNNINEYALEILTEEERQFIEKINKIVGDFVNERSDRFIDFDDIINLKMIWQKYHYLKPFQFSFDPENKMPKVFRNRTAFIIWTAWRASHLVCQDDDVKGGSLAAAKVLSKYKLPFPEEAKKEAVEEFVKFLHPGYIPALPGAHFLDNEFDFWEKEIFPFLEGEWEFKWDVVQRKLVRH